MIQEAQKLIAPCGIDCKICDAYIATQNQDPELKQKLADGYEAQMGAKISFEELDCDGCNNPGRHISFCDICQIRLCARDKGYITCAECADFPCEKGSFIWTTNSVSKANLDALRS